MLATFLCLQMVDGIVRRWNLFKEQSTRLQIDRFFWTENELYLLVFHLNFEINMMIRLSVLKTNSMHKQSVKVCTHWKILGHFPLGNCGTLSQICPGRFSPGQI